MELLESVEPSPTIMVMREEGEQDLDEVKESNQEHHGSTNEVTKAMSSTASLLTKICPFLLKKRKYTVLFAVCGVYGLVCL